MLPAIDMYGVTGTNMSTSSPPSTLEILEKLVAESCHCKLREHCPDKNAPECLKHRNVYTEAVLAHKLTPLG